ncbi:MAG: polyphenol oxidase [Ponticaulis sp.]|nr:polyphenol oxidase [Ponticaulis sp.]|tara:strand:- start:13567 stop:14355 length:789 start_codon:yes stop_codon:yes gene_type:complete
MSSTPPFITAPHLTHADGISHGFFGREGGVSSGEYNSLNTGPGSNDDPEKVKENRTRVAAAMGAADMDHLISLFQIHSPNVVYIDAPFAWGERPEGDAMVTDVPGLALCVLTADCTPVLFADAEAGVIGAAHAGWKGALAGVIENTVDAMVWLGANRTHIKAAIGPSLSQDSFEVGPDLKEPFLDKHDWSAACFRPGQSDRSLFDIWNFCEAVLTRCGINQISCVSEDTLTQPDRYFSNRYRVKHNLSDYGRNASVIMLDRK